MASHAIEDKHIAFFGRFAVVSFTDGSVGAYEIYNSSLAGLREISELVKFEFDSKWNTQRFGLKLVNFLNENKQSVKQLLAERVKVDTAESAPEFAPFAANWEAWQKLPDFAKFMLLLRYGDQPLPEFKEDEENYTIQIVDRSLVDNSEKMRPLLDVISKSEEFITLVGEKTNDSHYFKYLDCCAMPKLFKCEDYDDEDGEFAQELRSNPLVNFKFEKIDFDTALGALHKEHMWNWWQSLPDSAKYTIFYSFEQDWAS